MSEKERLIQLSEGVYVERDVWNVAEKIREYDDRLRLKYIANNANYSDAPYALFEMCPDGIERLIFTIWTLDDRVLDRLRNADNQRQNVLAGVELTNEQVTQSLKRRYQEKMLEKHDLGEHVFKSTKGRYSYKDDDGNIVQIDDDPARRGRTVLKAAANESRGD